MRQTPVMGEAIHEKAEIKEDRSTVNLRAKNGDH